MPSGNRQQKDCIDHSRYVHLFTRWLSSQASWILRGGQLGNGKARKRRGGVGGHRLGLLTQYSFAYARARAGEENRLDVCQPPRTQDVVTVSQVVVNQASRIYRDDSNVVLSSTTPIPLEFGQNSNAPVQPREEAPN